MTCICNDEADHDGRLIGCDKCEQWFHSSCMKLTEADVERIDKFYCTSCEDNFDILTTWKGRVATGNLLAFKNKHYHKVEAILDCRTKRTVKGTTRTFLVKWENYDESHNTWEPEHHLDGCLDLLHRFLKDKNLPVSTLRALLGSSDPDDGNIRNWVPTEGILAKINIWQNMRAYKTDLGCSVWDQFGSEDSIFLLGHDHHCYVILFIAAKQIAIIADGRNSYIEDAAFQHELKSLLNINLAAVSYNYQFKADQCATSAVMIALELMRAYKKAWLPVTLSPFRAIAARFAKKRERESCATFGRAQSSASAAASIYTAGPAVTSPSSGRQDQPWPSLYSYNLPDITSAAWAGV